MDNYKRKSGQLLGTISLTPNPNKDSMIEKLNKMEKEFNKDSDRINKLFDGVLKRVAKITETVNEKDKK